MGHGVAVANSILLVTFAEPSVDLKDSAARGRGSRARFYESGDVAGMIPMLGLARGERPHHSDVRGRRADGATCATLIVLGDLRAGAGVRARKSAVVIRDP